VVFAHAVRFLCSLFLYFCSVLFKYLSFLRLERIRTEMSERISKDAILIFVMLLVYMGLGGFLAALTEQQHVDQLRVWSSSCRWKSWCWQRSTGYFDIPDSDAHISAADQKLLEKMEQR
jgi:hypothetical protein